MQLLKDKILSEAEVLPGHMLKVGSFLNQQVDTELLREMAKELARRFADSGANKIMTIESSGIPLAVAAGMEMGLPVLFAKKHSTSHVDGYVYSTSVHSTSHGIEYNMMVSCDYLLEDDRVLLVDDFLSNGNAIRGMMELVEQAGATVAGVAVAIEKGYQKGGDSLRRDKIRVEALAVVESIEGSAICFRQ